MTMSSAWKSRIKARAEPDEGKTLSPGTLPMCTHLGNESWRNKALFCLRVPHSKLLTKLQHRKPLPKGTGRDVSAERKHPKTWGVT